MKTLEQYILEERQVIGLLPFDVKLFTNFINDAIIDANYDDSEYWDYMKDIIERHYLNTWNIFYSWCESIMELNITPEEFYEKLKLIPLDRINRVLGAGSNGIVLDMGDRVIKIYYSKSIKKIDKPFYDWCKTHNSKVFPKVYKMGRNWITMEKLNVNTKRVKDFYNMIDNSIIDGKSIYNWVKESNIDRSKFSKKELEVLDWCITCKNEMCEIKSASIEWPGDLRLSNIGERKNGEIVFFDI